MRGELGSSSSRPCRAINRSPTGLRLFAALAEGESRMENFLVSGVTRAMLDALTVLGVRWSLDGTTLTRPGCWLAAADRLCRRCTLQCGNSATTLRLLAGALAAWSTSGCPGWLAGLAPPPDGADHRAAAADGRRISAEQGCAPLTLERFAQPVARPSITAAGCQRAGQILPAAGGVGGGRARPPWRARSFPRPYRAHAARHGCAGDQRSARCGWHGC